MRQDHAILEELLDVVEEFAQRAGDKPARDPSSSVRRLRGDLMEFRDAAESGQLDRTTRRRKSGRLLARILALHPAIWTQ
jgi:ribosomal protein L29